MREGQVISDNVRAIIGAVLGASAAGVGATAAAPDAAPVFALSLAGAGGAIGAGLHQLGRAITIWIEADAAMRREITAQIGAVRELVEKITKGAP
jgi:hypothetical protein